MKTTFINALAMTIMVATFFVEMIIYFNSNKDAGSTAIQIISSCISLQGVVVGYFFVSSKNSQTKDATIASIAQAAAGPQTVKADVVNADNVEQVNTNTVTVK